MKKQIFTLVLFVMATFASVNNSYGQACDDALHPIAGKKYTYTVSVNPTGGTFNWYVVTSADLMPSTSTKADGTYITGGTGYNSPGSTSATVDITWSSKAVKDALAGTTKFYLVVNYMNTGCTDNLKAYKITPINLFQILVENINSTGGAYADICRSNVVSATLDGSELITYNYGENALYLKITANYFTTSWTPKIDMTALNASLSSPQVVKSIEWSLNTTFTGTGNFNLTTGVATANVPDKAADGITSGTDEFIYVKIIVTDGKFEGTGDQNIALNVSATDAFTNPDVDKDASCADIPAANDPDKVVQVLKARPTITSATPVIPSGNGVFILPN